MWDSNVLKTNDDKMTPVALYTESNLSTGAKATLEISAESEHMIELIVISWVFVQKQRQSSGKAMATIGMALGNM